MYSYPSGMNWPGTIRNNAEVHNAMMKDHMAEMKSGKFSERPLPDRLAMQVARMESRLQQVKDVRASLEKLYAVLDDEQQKSADEIVLPMMGMGMGRGMGPHDARRLTPRGLNRRHGINKRASIKTIQWVREVLAIGKPDHLGPVSD
jgi:hypothetical protein